MDKQPGETLTYKEYCELENVPDAYKAEAYIAGGLRGGWEWRGWFYTIVGKSILCEATMRLNRLRYYDM